MADNPADETEENTDVGAEEELAARHRKEKKDLQGYLTFSYYSFFSVFFVIIIQNYSYS